MSSINQIKANRLNSQLSTGPTTPEGKSASASNSLKHGIYSTAILLPNEDPDAYQSMCNEFFTGLHPIGPLERTLVQRLIDCQWRMNRLDAIEAGFYEQDDDDTPTQVFSFNVAQGYFVELSRQWARQERTFRRAMLDLLALQKERKQAPSEQLASIPHKPAPRPAALAPVHAQQPPTPSEPSPDTGPLAA